ncbi:MAG: helix-turn-helix domain-containing protein [Deltaproteobacteria bacterium]|nr:helix-turn-helix domain-containing protein [Chloroflexota bacterium]MBM4385515.1 helix-turn-helix domain-containing protein [Deltaproteobacteria bacterium]
MDRRNRDEGSVFLDTANAGELLRISPRTLEGLRVRGGGPPFRKHGGRVRYCLADLIEWSEQSRRTSTSDPNAEVRRGPA